MQTRVLRTAADEAADAFYGQPAGAFAQQIAEICKADERLIAVFQRTRERHEARQTGEQ